MSENHCEDAAKVPAFSKCVYLNTASQLQPRNPKPRRVARHGFRAWSRPASDAVFFELGRPRLRSCAWLLVLC
jgi:hypothetical protein